MQERTILCVDDSPTQLRLISELLTGMGCRVITAADGEEGLRKAREHCPDLILLDVVLPGMNGYQVCRELKSSGETAGIKIVLVTGKSQPSDRYWGLRQGADDYLAKPVDAVLLRDSVTKHLH